MALCSAHVVTRNAKAMHELINTMQESEGMEDSGVVPMLDPEGCSVMKTKGVQATTKCRPMAPNANTGADPPTVLENTMYFRLKYTCLV